MKEINLAWMYPDVFNLHGDRGNIMALVQVAKAMNIDLNVIRVENSESLPDLSQIDIVYFGAGQLKDIERIIDDANKYKEQLIEFIDSNKHVIAIGSTVALLGKQLELPNEESINGLGILGINSKGLNRTTMPFVSKEVYGDDLYFKMDDGLDIIGCQIQRLDFTLESSEKPLGKVLYGYGNNLVDKIEGMRHKNLYFTNIVGPLFTCNPWLAMSIFNEVAKIKGFELEECKEDDIVFMEYAKKALDAKKAFITNKTKIKGINYTNF